MLTELFLLQTGVKLFCYFWSLPIPTVFPKRSAEGGDKVNPSPFEEKMLNKLLLVGPDKSGTSTIFKQVRYFIWKSTREVNNFLNGS